ncbi:hypothetical protein RIF25_15815 [Thermosynechococcaceae cyanobacterium BACA0444]|uniref:HTH cro/C1-type domain-containing protein n=1 Tax=Pseudocalidococcus azoricus BACA0444 TaxID=2918990 RepID=A0AAE4FWI0_9CYAN|nr:ImmA/IrrE family metallo-endopeptidase [Pseudocalidococcus azoricus]MDS3862266.1 hypothetical protein [Pseudocalidococcus azoricus BACA0444]
MTTMTNPIPIKPIKSEADYDAALEQIAVLMDAGPGTPEADALDVLATLVENYENQHYPIGLPDPISAIRFRMEQQELSQRDLIPFIGSRSKVSEVLSGKRSLSLQMIRNLHQGLGIPADVLLQEPDATLPENPQNVDWSKFPLPAMAKQKWIESDFSGKAEELMRDLIERAGGYSSVSTMFCRKNSHIRSKTDSYALKAWAFQLLAMARETSLPTSYRPGSLTPELMQQLVRLSWSESGPRLAQEFLARNGIHLIYLPHLPQTHLDGAALRLSDGTPVIGLTLRYDRIDNFWFCLFHELAHQALHLEFEPTDSYLEDLSIADPKNEPKELEADGWASEQLIPNDLWAASRITEHSSIVDIKEFANRLQIHPAIVAGRIRKLTNNYHLFNQLVGHRQVRTLFA